MNDFSKKTLSKLAKKNITIIGKQAIPDFKEDKYFSGTAYQLQYNGIGFIRTHSQIIVMAASSWNPETYFNNYPVS